MNKYQGDSGGTFTVKNEGTNQHDLVGVVSWGEGCAAVGFLIMIDDKLLHSVQCKYGALMKISNEGNKQAQTYAASDLAYVLNISNVASHQHHNFLIISEKPTSSWCIS